MNLPDSRDHRATTLWAGICCSGLPLAAVWQLEFDEGLRAVHERHRDRACIFQANPAARQAGLVPGQPLETALAIAPGLESRPRNRAMEHQVLEDMALAAYGHSHQVALAPPDTVILEVGGSRRLRGGINPLLDALSGELESRNLAVTAGTAPFPAAARLLARLGQHAPNRETLLERLSPLPLAILELEPSETRALAGCGLKTAGELFSLPAPERARRFGLRLNRYLEEIRGERATPLAGWHPPETFSLELELPMATDDARALGFALNRGLDTLGRWLRVRDQALNRLDVGLRREDGGTPATFQIGMARPGFDQEHLIELIRLRLNGLRLAAPIVSFRMSADTTGEYSPPQTDLWSGANRGDAWPALLDRLATRLGEDHILGLATQADHRPEKAWRWVRPGTSAPVAESAPRPNWLLPEPRPCQRENLRLEEGPERIESGWWDGRDCRRDYWIARDGDGRKLWVFREHKPRQGWFVHGLFG